MNWMTCFASAIALALPTVAIAGPIVTARDQTEIRAFLTRTLTAYVADREPPSWPRAFTPEMRRLVDLNQRLNRGNESEALGADPVCGCQDWRTIHVTNITLAPRADGKAIATVRITNFGPKTRIFVMARAAAGWRIDDVIEGGRYGLRRALLRDNARLSGRSRPQSTP